MKKSCPVFKYHIAGFPGELDSSSYLWNKPLLQENPEDSLHPAHKEDSSNSIMIHEYLEAAKLFLSPILLSPETCKKLLAEPSCKAKANYDYESKTCQTKTTYGYESKTCQTKATYDYENKASLHGKVIASQTETPAVPYFQTVSSKTPSLQSPDSGETVKKEITDVDLFLEKHGAFYHPVRVKISLRGGSWRTFALNGALSSQGLSLIEREYNLLKKLEGKTDGHLIPHVFEFGTQECRGMTIAFFLAEWFEDYREFHLTDNSGNFAHSSEHSSNSSGSFADSSEHISNFSGKVTDSPDHLSDSSEFDTLNLWNSDGTRIEYHRPEYFEIYEKASEILTTLYDLNTFEQVFPWHHAAGDFVAKPLDNGFDVKLITVRSYTSMFLSESEPTFDKEEINKGLLLFLVMLSIRMRIDRIDGTGKYCLVHHDSINYILKGFFRALNLKRTDTVNYHIDYQEKTITLQFAEYLELFDHKALLQILDMITDTGNPENPEFIFIKQNIHSHAKFLSQKIGESGKKCFFIDKASQKSYMT
ncbi:hypothetical protein MTBBW1_1940079 [Desulfamplus magnetovallimortis]|uniref:Uncharacterized protein n=1 Tax=Desulfamplus magnetovallimortis TaxID=1246637 RepID=A0A1W1HBG9_9BACT|nr:hypothetical protein [Desulfamplus magnetovallimortis]SLM29752.1 hypothetical protein MTBBW1_1940079 [Desulfamplus magnetovallimortis]